MENPYKAIKGRALY